MAPKAKKTDRASVQKAANAAEKRAAKAQKADTVKPIETPARVNNDDQERALFLHHLPKIADKKALLTKISGELRVLYKTAKADGFTKKDFDTAFVIQGAEGEKAKKAAIARELKIAQWLGCADLGAQLDMFERDAGVPAVDRAYEEGKTDSMLGKSASPSYDPSLPQHKRYMEGYHDATEARVKAGITKLHPEVQKDEADKAAKKKKREEDQAKDAQAFDAPSSGVAMTRSEFKQQQAARDGQGDTAIN